MSLRHAVLVVAQMFNVLPLLWDRHSGRSRIDAESSNEGKYWRIWIRGRRLQDWQKQQRQKRGRNKVYLYRYYTPSLSVTFFGG